MKVLIISANSLPSAPSGPAYMAGAALEAGHTVEVFEALFAQDLIGELEQQLINFSPDVVAISIRLVHGSDESEPIRYPLQRFFDVWYAWRDTGDYFRNT